MTTVRTAQYQQELYICLEHAVSMDAAVAFASIEGLRFRSIDSRLENLLKKGGRVRILVDLRLANTHPDFLAQILDWQGAGLKIECRHYDAGNGLFHPKLYIFHLADGSTQIVAGSANWTGEAYSSNVEYGLALQGNSAEALLVEAQHFFDDLWGSENAKNIDLNSLEIYRSYWRKRQGMERKSIRRASGIWNRLQEYLAAEQPRPGFHWPSRNAAFLLGCLTARGSIERLNNVLRIELRYGGNAYRHGGRVGYIGKGNVAFEAASVVPLVPQALADRITPTLAPATPSVRQTGRWTFLVEIDCHQQLLDELHSFFGSAVDYHAFPIPRQIMNAERELQEEFLRGYGLACALVSEGTYDPTYNHQVWLRPATSNARQFDQLADLLEKSLGIAIYKHRRATRDVAVKVRCEAWLDIGFGTDWLDAIVEEGARLNGALAPPQVS